MILPAEISPLPDVYRPEALILVRGESGSSGFGQDSGSSAGSLAALLTVSGAAGTSYGSLARELITSDSILDSVAQNQNVAERYDITENLRTNSREALKERLDVNFQNQTGLLRVGFEDTDANFATAVVRDIVTVLDQRFRTIGGDRAATRKELLEEKSAEVESRIAELESRIIEFTNEYGILDVRTVSERQAQTIANLRSDLMLKQMEIQTYRDFARIDDPVLQRLRTERSNLRDLIEQMEGGSSGVDGSLPTQRDIPQLMFEYERLQRNLDVQARIYENLAAELELARLNAEGQEPILQTLELPKVPEVEAGPNRALMSVVVTIMAAMIAIGAAFLVQLVDQARRDEHTAAKFRSK